MIEITVFGSGSKGNAYLVDDGKTQLMIECGVSFSKVHQIMKHNMSKVVGCLVSHEHRDHCKYVKKIIDETAIDIYATPGTIDGLFDDSALRLNRFDRYRFELINYKTTTAIGSWFVTPFETQHDANQPCGFMIDNSDGDRLIFITDSYYVKYKFPRVTHMMIEANYSKEIIDETMTAGFDLKRKGRLLESHFDLKNTLKFIESNKSDKLQSVHLIHLSDSNSNEREFKEQVQKLTGVPVYIA